jgi:hypothetical protein
MSVMRSLPSGDIRAWLDIRQPTAQPFRLGAQAALGSPAKLRLVAEAPGLKKKPSTSELLDWLKLLRYANATPRS